MYPAKTHEDQVQVIEHKSNSKQIKTKMMVGQIQLFDKPTTRILERCH